MALSNSIQCKFAKETTWGTAATRNVRMPFTTWSADPEVDEIIDDATRGDASYDYAVYAGMGRSNLELEAPAYPVEVGYFIHGVMGTASYATATHTFSVGTSVPSFTFEDDDPVQARVYTGCQVSSFSLRFNRAEGLVTFNTKMIGKLPTTTTSTTVADASGKPWIGWTGVFSVDGTAAAKLISGELTWERTQEPSPHANNSQDMARLDTGRIRYTGSLVFDGASDELLTYLTNTNGTPTPKAVVLSFTNADSNVITVTSTNTTFLAEGMKRDMGGNAKRMSVGMRGVRNSTDGGPCKVTLTNSKATSY